MEGLHRKLIILGLGIAVILAAAFGFPDKKKKPRLKGEPETVVSPAPAASDSRTEDGDLSPELRAKQLAVLSKPCGRDPFSQYSKDRWKPDDLSMLDLKGICYRKGARPVALLGDSIVKEGDFVGKAQVVEIGKDYVRLRKGAREYKLLLEGAR